MHSFFHGNCFNILKAKSHDTRTRDTEETKIRVFDTRHDDPRNRTRGTRFIYIVKNYIYILKKYIKIYIFLKLEVYTMYINHNIIQLKFDNDESVIKLSMNHELWNHKLHIWYFSLNHKNQNVLHRYRENATDKYKIE